MNDTTTTSKNAGAAGTGQREVANARLIDTAPELLAALLHAESSLVFFTAHFPPDTNAKHYTVPREAMTAGLRAMDEARAAIAKAKGGAQ